MAEYVNAVEVLLTLTPMAAVVLHVCLSFHAVSLVIFNVYICLSNPDRHTNFHPEIFCENCMDN